MAKPHHNGQHQKVRAEVARQMTTTTACVLCNQVRCPKTGQLLCNQRWHLAHDDRDPSGNTWLGPAHVYCNESTWAQSPRYRGHHRYQVMKMKVIDRGRGRLRRIADGDVDE